MKKSVLYICAAVIVVGCIYMNSHLAKETNTMNGRNSTMQDTRNRSADNSIDSDLVDNAENSSTMPEQQDIDGEELDSEAQTVLEKVHALVGTEDSPAWSPYADVVDALDEECIPVLIELLQKDSYKSRWAQIAYMISWLSEGNDKQGLDAIMSYIRRRDAWSDSDDRQSGAHLLGKAKSLGFSGLIEANEASGILESVFTTQEGAKQLIEGWIDLPHPIGYDSRSLINDFRGQAARGLVLSRRPESIAMIKDKFEEFAHETMSEEYFKGQHDEETVYRTQYYYAMVDALAENDMIVDMGLEQFLRLIDTTRGLEMKDSFMDKYWGEWTSDERVLIDPCPICGLTRK